VPVFGNSEVPAILPRASRPSIGTIQMVVFDWSDERSLIDCRVLRWRAPLASLRVAAALRIFSAAATSPSALMMTARFSLSASASLAMVRFMLSGRPMSLSSTASTRTPQGSEALSTICWMRLAISSLFLRSSSRVTSPTALRIVVWASWLTANMKFSTSRTDFDASRTL